MKYLYFLDFQAFHLVLLFHQIINTLKKMKQIDCQIFGVVERFQLVDMSSFFEVRVATCDIIQLSY